MPAKKTLVAAGAATTAAALIAAAVLSTRAPAPPPAPPRPVSVQPGTPAVRSIAWRSMPNARDKLEVDYSIVGDRGIPTYIDTPAKDVPALASVLTWAEEAGRRSRQGAVATFLTRDVVGGEGYGKLRIGVDLTALGAHEVASPLVVQVEKLPQKTRKLVEDVDTAAFHVARADLEKRIEDEKKRASAGGN